MTLNTPPARTAASGPPKLQYKRSVHDYHAGGSRAMVVRNNSQYARGVLQQHNTTRIHHISNQDLVEVVAHRPADHHLENSSHLSTSIDPQLTSFHTTGELNMSVGKQQNHFEACVQQEVNRRLQAFESEQSQARQADRIRDAQSIRDKLQAKLNEVRAEDVATMRRIVKERVAEARRQDKKLLRTMMIQSMKQYVSSLEAANNLVDFSQNKKRRLSMDR